MHVLVLRICLLRVCLLPSKPATILSKDEIGKVEFMRKRRYLTSRWPMPCWMKIRWVKTFGAEHPAGSQSLSSREVKLGKIC